MAARSRNDKHDRDTKTPIKHVIVIVGENRTFDHVFATYKPKHGQRVDNLLAKGIIKEDGSPGPNYALAVQKSASDTTSFELSPAGKKAYKVLPPALAGGPTTPYLATLADAKLAEGNALPKSYLPFLTTGGTGLKSSSAPDAFTEPVRAAAWFIPAHALDQVYDRLCGEPGAPLLPDVAAARLQRLTGER